MKIKLFLIFCLLFTSESVFADKKVTYKYEEGTYKCKQTSTRSFRGIISSSTFFGKCSIDEIGAIAKINTIIDGTENTIYYDIKPKPKTGCGIKYNPKNGTSIYIKCFD